MNLAFRLREGEQSLSGDHFEYYTDNHYNNILNALRTRHFSPSPNGRFLKLNCGKVINKIQPFCQDETYFERDESGSHAGLFGIIDAHSFVTVLIKECIVEAVDVLDVN